MFYDITRKNKNCVPLTLKELKNKLSYNKKIAKKFLKMSYNLYNKNYRKMNWDKLFYTKKDIIDNIQDDYYKCYRRLLSDGELKPIFNKSGENYYCKENVEGICLLKEIGAKLEDNLFSPKGKTKYRVKYIPFYFDSKYIGKCYICSYPKTLEWKAPLLTEFLQDKHYIFDQENQFGRPLKELRRFIGKNLMKGKVEKWNYYFQRFLSEKTK